MSQPLRLHRAVGASPAVVCPLQPRCSSVFNLVDVGPYEQEVLERRQKGRQERPLSELHRNFLKGKLS